MAAPPDSALATPPSRDAPGLTAPPHDLEAEMSVLGSILISDRTLYALVIEEGLKGEDFYRERHRLIYESMLALYHENEPVDVVTVTDHLRQRGRLDEAGGASAVDALAAAPPSVSGARRYAQIVREHALLRRLLTTTYRIQTEVGEHRFAPRDLVERAEKAMLEVAHDDRQADFREISAILSDELRKMELLSKHGTALTGTPSGFKDLDEITGGFQPGNLIIVAARPSMGKCLVGRSLIFDPITGARRPMREVVSDVEAGKKVWVAALGSDLKLRPARVTAAFRNGVKPIVRVTTRRGRRIEATDNHPLLTLRGWSPISRLEVGDRVAVPRHPRGKEEAVGRALAGLETVQAGSTNVDTIPKDVWPLVLAAKGDRPWREASTATGRPLNHDWHVGTRGLSRPLLGELATRSGSAELSALARSDLWWDEIASIERRGEEETYDITVPVHHNFVADDVIVHNSALVTNIAENAAIDHERAVAMFSLEMSETELAQRFVASQGRIFGDKLRKGRVPDSEWPRILEASQRLARAPLYVDDSSDIGILDIRAKARRLHSQHKDGLGLIVIDYLQLLRPEPGADSRVEQVGQMSRGLKILARELNVPVIALSQLSRAVEQRHDKKPILSDLRECVTGDTLVVLADGSRTPIRELVGTTPDVVAVDEHDRLVTARADKVWPVGHRAVFAVRLATGRVLRATVDHRIRCAGGWRRLHELGTDDLVGLAREFAVSDQRLERSVGASATLVRGATVLAGVEGDLAWDRVVAIEPDGVEEVYDLTVPGPSCWLADGIVSHNSGQIEQDADLVMFIYRDEYYNKDESEEQGLAELLIAKHRNGGLGDVTLTFRKEYPKFLNYAGERYGQ